MSKHLNIGETVEGSAFTLPADAITQTFAILAKRRVGKTYTASVMAEELVRLGLPFVALDPTGAWWGLRATEAGKPNGSPVIIIGGEHGDVPLEATAGKVIAELVVENPGQYVIDLSGTNSNADQDRFVCDFAERLYRLKASHKTPLHLFLDEADSFAPQNPMPGQQRMLGAIEALVRRGGIRGIGITLISQRSAVLNKNVLTQTECLVAMQITSPQDIGAIDKWIKNHAVAEQRETVIGSLASLPKGRAWFWSPGWLGCLVQVNVRKRVTYNSSATPEVGQKNSAAVKLAPADLEKIRDKVRATIEKVKADDPRELKKEIAALKRESDKLKLELQAGKPVKVETKIKEVLILKEPELKRLEAVAERANRFSEMLATILLKLAHKVGLVPTREEIARELGVPNHFRGSRALVRAPVRDIRLARTNDTPHTEFNGHLPIGERKVLAACIQFPAGLQRNQLTVLTGYKRSSRDAYIARLREKSFVSAEGEVVTATPEGTAALPDYEPLPTGEALQDYWRHKLPIGELKILEALMEIYPEAMEREALMEKTGYMRSSRDTYLARLRAKQLITEPASGQVRASENLFEL
jgi:hypothetical protein